MEAKQNPDAFKMGSQSEKTAPPENPHYQVGLNMSDSSDKSVFHTHTKVGGKCKMCDADCMGGMREY